MEKMSLLEAQELAATVLTSHDKLVGNVVASFDEYDLLADDPQPSEPAAPRVAGLAAPLVHCVLADQTPTHF